MSIILYFALTIDSAKRIAYSPVVVRTGSRVDSHCQTPISLAEPLSFAAFFKEREGKGR